MAINQTIQDFYSQASKRNFSRDFQLRITSFQVNGINLVDENDLVFLKTASLPGKTISVHQAPYMGLQFNIPGSVVYDGSQAWATTFYCTQDFNLRNLLERSMIDTFDQGSSIGFMRPRDLNAYRIDLTLIDDQFNPIRTYGLLGCFVTSIGAINYNVTGNGAIQEITTNIAYQYWTGAELGVRGGNNGSFGGVLGQIGGAASQIGGAVSRVSSILKQIGGIFK